MNLIDSTFWSKVKSIDIIIFHNWHWTTCYYLELYLFIISQNEKDALSQIYFILSYLWHYLLEIISKINIFMNQIKYLLWFALNDLFKNFNIEKVLSLESLKLKANIPLHSYFWEWREVLLSLYCSKLNWHKN